MIKKEDIVSMIDIIEKHEEGVNYKSLYDKLKLILKGINLQEELNNNADELQKLGETKKEK